YLNKLPAQAKAAMLDRLLLSKLMESAGKTLRRSGDGSGWEVAGADGKIEGTLRIRGTFTSGVDALVPLEIQRDRDSLTVLIGLRLEDGSWRLTEAGEWQSKKLEDTLLHQEGADKGSDASVESTLRTLTTAMVTYASTYPETGYPYSLRALSGKED